MLNKKNSKTSKNNTMKKKTILLAILFAVTASTTFAKDISEKKNLFGFNVGLGVSSVGIKDSLSSAKNGIKPGGDISFTFEHRFKKVVAIQTGLSYTNKGTKFNYTKNALIKSGSKQYDFHNLEIPLLVKFYIGKKKIFNIYTGVYAAYTLAVSTQEKVDFVDPFTDINKKKNNILTDDTENFKDADGDRLLVPFDAGVKLGFEFVSKRGFGVGANINQGFIDVTNSKFNIGSISENKVALHTSANIYAIFKF